MNCYKYDNTSLYIAEKCVYCCRIYNIYLYYIYIEEKKHCLRQMSAKIVNNSCLTGEKYVTFNL